MIRCSLTYIALASFLLNYGRELLCLKIPVFLKILFLPHTFYTQMKFFARFDSQFPAVLKCFPHKGDASLKAASFN